jgi:Polyketide cyclase / dehydrase and lipid transport
MTVIKVETDSTLPPDGVLRATYDFSDRRESIFPAVSVKRMNIHEHGQTDADVTEGTRAGPIVNWERCRYDWSIPDRVVATVIDSNVYATPGSRWEIIATPTEGGSHVEMTWIREFKRGPRGRFFGLLFRLFGNRIFHGYGVQTIKNMEELEDAGESIPLASSP